MRGEGTAQSGNIRGNRLEPAQRRNVLADARKVLGELIISWWIFPAARITSRSREEPVINLP
jgi:hypothetical protein